MAYIDGYKTIGAGINLVIGVSGSSAGTDRALYYGILFDPLPTGAVFPQKALDLWIVQTAGTMPIGNLSKSRQIAYESVWTSGIWVNVPTFAGSLLATTLYVRPTPPFVGAQLYWWYETSA
jgi:hypothetical protein